MAVIVKTRYPEELKNQIRKSIEDQDIITWICDSDGDFTSSEILWKNRAWFRA